ncbi:MAG: heat shock protein Hsp20 [Sporomusa sp.]|nr:heat shock protein Hsp20 [Sporomusa sp.]
MFNLVPFGKNYPLEKREDFFNQVFDNFFREDFFAPLTKIGNDFRVDLKEVEDSYLIEADLPGIKKEDIALQYANNYLTIIAKRHYNEENKQDNYLRRERRYGEFQRSFYIGNVQENQIDAEFKDGVLIITLPKKDKAVQNVNTIPIR